MRRDRFVETLPRTLSALLVLAMPLVFSPYWYRYRDLKDATLLFVGPLILAAAFFGPRVVSRRMPRLGQLPETLRLPLLLLAAWELLGLVWAVDLQLGLRRVGSDLILLALFGIVHVLGRRKRERSLFLILVLSTGFLVAAFSLYQRAGGAAGLDRFYSDVQLRKGPATFGNPNFLAHYLVGTTLLGIGWLLFGSASARPRSRWLVAGGTLTGLQALLLTQSRGAYLAIGLTSVLLLIRYAASAKRRTAAWAIPLLLAALLLANLFWLPRSLVRQMDPQTPSNRFRLRTYSEALVMIADNPAGIGRGQTERVFPLYRKPLPERASWFRASHLHSDPLEWTAELGLPGFLLGIWLLVAAAKRIRQSLRCSTESLAWCAPVLGLMVHALFSFPLHLLAPSLLGVLALAMALSSGPGEDPKPAAQEKTRPLFRAVGWVALPIVLLLVQIRFGLLPMQASRLHREAVSQAGAEQAAPLFEKGAALVPEDLELLYDAGLFHLKHGQHNRAQDAFQAYVDRFPSNPKAWFNLGSAALQAGRPEAALDALLRSERLHPYSPPTLALLGKLFAGQDQLDRAETCFLRVSRLEPQNARAQYNLAALYTRQGRWEPARQRCQLALRLSPAYAPAQSLWQQLQEPLPPTGAAAAQSLTSPRPPGTMRADHE